MSSQPLISIVVPHFNRSALLAQTLDSIRAQAYENWEVLVVDDGSENSEWAKVQGMADDRVRVTQRTDGLKGPSRCRNLGAEAAIGDYLIFVDSDDILAQWCLSQRMKSVAQESELDLWIFPVLLFRRTPGDLSTCWNRLEGGEDLNRFLRSDPPWHTSSPIWRKSVFLAIGGFNEKVLYGDDAELHTRALLHSVAYEKFPELLPDVFVRRGDDARITNQQSESLIDSRRKRLIEGTNLLEHMVAPQSSKDIWEGQYFVEGEELLFNVDSSKKAIEDVINSWVYAYQPSIFRRQIVLCYFRSALFCRDHAYLLLRLARRLVKRVLPGQFFPEDSQFHQFQLSADELHELQKRVGS